MKSEWSALCSALTRRDFLRAGDAAGAAAQYASCHPIIERVPLSRIPEASISAVTTLYVPPQAIAPIDYAMLDRLGIPRKILRKPRLPSRQRRNAGTLVASSGKRKVLSHH